MPAMVAILHVRKNNIEPTVPHGVANGVYCLRSFQVKSFEIGTSPNLLDLGLCRLTTVIIEQNKQHRGWERGIPPTHGYKEINCNETLQCVVAFKLGSQSHLKEPL